MTDTLLRRAADQIYDDWPVEDMTAADPLGRLTRYHRAIGDWLINESNGIGTDHSRRMASAVAQHYLPKHTQEVVIADLHRRIMKIEAICNTGGKRVDTALILRVLEGYY